MTSFLIWSALLLLSLVSADLFTAIADMQHMLGAEKEVNRVIEEYISVEQQRLDQLKRLSNRLIGRSCDSDSLTSTQPEMLRLQTLDQIL